MSSSNDSAKPKLLLVAYDFPPVTSAGMYRIVGMTKYLQRLGWEITVLTVKDTFVHKTEASLKMIPAGVRVLRTSSFEFRRFARSVTARIRGTRDLEGRETASSGGLRELVSQALELVFRLIDKMFRFPDIKAGWFVPLFFNAWRVLGRERFDVVLSSSPPHSLHLPLLCLRKLKYFRWVTDFRDPWTVPERTESVTLGLRVRQAMEKWVISKCDFVVANTRGNRDALVRKFGSAIEPRITVVTNGLDLELDSPNRNGETERLECDFVYVGEVYPGMLDVYIDALRLIRDQGIHRIPRLWVYGETPSSVVLGPIRERALDEWIVFKGRVPYNIGRRIVREAKALLLLLPHRKGDETWVPSKLYSYLFSPAPILALVPEGDVSRVLEETGRGLTVGMTRSEEVAEAIVAFLGSIKGGTIQSKGNQEEIQGYRMDAVMTRLDDVLRHCMVS